MVYQINILMYVFCLILLILLESTFLTGENSSEQKTFRSVFHYTYIVFVLQIAWNIFDGRIFEGCRIINYLICIISSVATSICSYKWFCYYERLTNPKKSFSLVHNILVLVPLVVFVGLISTTFITNWLFYIDDNNFYEKGTLYWLNILTSCFYLVLAIFCALFSLLKKVSTAQKKRYLIIGCFSLIPLVAIVYKLFDHTNLTISQLCIVLGLTCVYVNVQQQKITRDALTKLNNRISLEKYLDDVISKYSEEREPINLIFIDIVNFKKINSLYGHVEGDVVICDVADTLKKLCSTRKCFLARYNGDIFAIVTKNILSNEVYDFKQEIVKEIENIQTAKGHKLTPLICNSSFDLKFKNTKNYIQKTLAINTEVKQNNKKEAAKK